MIKLVVSDLDGTLLSDIKDISDENKNAVLNLKNKDIIFCIATGRLDASARNIAKQLGGNYHIISCNGALIKDDVENKIIYKRVLKKELAIVLTELFEKMNLVYHFYTEKCVYSKTLSNSALCYSEQNSKSKTSNEIVEIVISDNMIEKAEITEDILKFIVFLSDEKERSEVLEKLKYVDGIEISQSTSNNLEIMMENVSKGSAIKMISDMYNISDSQIMVLGDQINDLSMFDKLRYKVAMENGHDKLKSSADFITKSNNDNGVAYAINKVIFEKESD